MYPTQDPHAGEVRVAPGAHVAAGVLLYAQVGSRIEIEAGACIGEHCIVHAFGGSLVIAAGATLGAGVLVFGGGAIGARASIGERSTLIHPEIVQDGVVPAGSLIGDRSRPVADPGLYQPPGEGSPSQGVTGQGATNQVAWDPPPLDPGSAVPSDTSVPLPQESSGAQPPTGTADMTGAATAPSLTPPPLSPTERVRQDQAAAKERPIPGHATLQQLLRKIYPHRQEENLLNSNP